MALEFVIDLIVGLNIVLIFGSLFLAMALIKTIGLGDSFVLTKGWKFVLPAVGIFAVIQVYEFFTSYTTYTPSRGILQSLYLCFNVLIFTGLLVQFLAIKKVYEERR